MGVPDVSDLKGLFNHCKAGQHIRNRDSDHTDQHDCRCHDTSSGAAVVEAGGIAARAPSLPRQCRRLPAAKSSHCYDESIPGDNIHDVSLLNTVGTDGSIGAARFRIVADSRGGQRN